MMISRDLVILKMQNNHRFFNMEENFGLPFGLSFCRDFCFNNKRNRDLQRHLCEHNCFWNPQACLLDQSHSGNLAELMEKPFHDNFNPSFKSLFGKKHSVKIDWSLTGGVGRYPSLGLSKLIEEMGITTELQYDANGSAVNLTNLCREFRDSDPVRPYFIMEEKKVHDITEALLVVNTSKIEENKIEMQSMYDESYNANGLLRKPILSLMMWGPLAGYDDLQTVAKICKVETTHSSSQHACSNFTEKHYWMFSHGSKVDCEKGPIEQLIGPAMTHDMRVIYPCNKLACNQGCKCYFCVLRFSCPPNEPKQHILNSEQECEVQSRSQCQYHWVDHPDNFDEKEDISVEKNIFFHNGILVKQPRRSAVDLLKFSGITKYCNPCCKNVKSHFKFHMVPHLQCKFCRYQLVDKKFWEKVCSICGKICSDALSLKYWHKKIHNSDWACDDCDIKLNRKWNLKRHLIEVHGLELHESDDNDGSQKVDAKKTKDLLNVANEKKAIYCSICKESFTKRGDLERHLAKHSLHQEKQSCHICGKKYTRKDYLQQHIKLIHMKEETIYTCRFCEKEFNRKHNLNKHERRMHGDN